MRNLRWLAAKRPDVVCLQEMKCQEIDLDSKLHGMKAYQTCFAFAEKKGYSGVALYSRRTPDEVRRGFEIREFDAAGGAVDVSLDFVFHPADLGLVAGNPHLHLKDISRREADEYK